MNALNVLKCHRPGTHVSGDGNRSVYGITNNHYLLGKKVVLDRVGLFVCQQNRLKSYEQIEMKFYGRIWGGKKNN